MGTLKRFPFPLLGVVAVVTTAFAMVQGCSAEDPTTVCDAGRCYRPDAWGDGSDGRPPGPLPTDLLSIDIMPANPVLEAVDGATPTQPFTVVGRQRDGRPRTLSSGIRFSMDNPSIGEIDADHGMFRSNGVGGLARVRATTLDGTLLSAETTLTVNARRTFLGPGVTAEDRDRYERAVPTADTSNGPRVDYPLDGAVMPRNVYPPKLMWTPRHTPQAPTDLYRVHLERPHATLDGYFRAEAGFQHAWSVAAEQWRTMADSDVGEPIRTTVGALTIAGRYDGPVIAFRTVDGVIAGSVYYWSPPQGRILRLDVDTARRVDFLPHPPGGCIACHAVSRDGRRMTGVTDDGRPLVNYDLTADLTGNPPPTVFRNGEQDMRVSSFNGDATRLVTSPHGGGPMAIVDGNTGATVVPAGTLPAGLDPEWSPDSSAIAYTQDNNLMLLPAMAGDTFGAPMMLHAGAASPGGTVDWHPTWSPNSQWLVFQHGAGAFTSGAASLWIIPRAGGAATRLDRLNGGLDQENNYRAVFSPFNSGGYFWVLFTSTRPYGNEWAGVRNHKQIWVAAIRNSPDGTSDPSEVAYYLEGQETVTNLSPHWAPPPCRGTGAACSTAGDCCSNNCEPDDTGRNVCRPNTACRARGASCDGNADCCRGLVCTEGRICDYPLPG